MMSRVETQERHLCPRGRQILLLHSCQRVCRLHRGRMTKDESVVRVERVRTVRTEAERVGRICEVRENETHERGDRLCHRRIGTHSVSVRDVAAFGCSFVYGFDKGCECSRALGTLDVHGKHGNVWTRKTNVQIHKFDASISNYTISVT